MDALSYQDRVTMETAKIIREDYLHQNAFDDVDTYTSPQKQYHMLRLILLFGEKGRAALDQGANLSQVLGMPVRERIGRAKYIKEEDMAQFNKIESELNDQIGALLTEGGM